MWNVRKFCQMHSQMHLIHSQTHLFRRSFRHILEESCYVEEVKLEHDWTGNYLPTIVQGLTL